MYNSYTKCSDFYGMQIILTLCHDMLHLYRNQQNDLCAILLFVIFLKIKEFALMSYKHLKPHPDSSAVFTCHCLWNFWDLKKIKLFSLLVFCSLCLKAWAFRGSNPKKWDWMSEIASGQSHHLKETRHYNF